MDDGGGPTGIDVPAVLRGLEDLLAHRRGPVDGEAYLRRALADAVALGDDAGRLTVLNELMGLLRALGRHEAAVGTAHDALTLVREMGLARTDAGASTLLNAATALRAAGRHAEARERYTEALEVAGATMAPTDRRIAALHNNLSLLASDLGDHALARTELATALDVLERASDDVGTDLDVATTCTNLALTDLALERDDTAENLLRRSIAIYARAGVERDPHHAAALAALAQLAMRRGRAGEAVALYERALPILAECYGVESDAWSVTAENLATAREAVAAVAAVEPGESEERTVRGSAAAPSVVPVVAVVAAPHVPGLQLAREYWETYGRPMLAERYPAHVGRIAAGLVGHGSECYGFDDALSRDHDVGPGFCLWLTQADHDEIGQRLQADYDTLPSEFRGHRVRERTPRAQGAGRRVGVFEIGAFHEGITGYREAPTGEHEWLLLEEATLAAATNGAVFADPLGAFSAVRGGFRRMPEDVRLALISRRLGMVAQAGQYNVPRMLGRGDGEGAWLAVAEMTGAVASLVFLLNRPVAVGYLPYYKWRFAALRALARRMGPSLGEVHGELSQVLALASTACLGREQGAGPGVQSGGDAGSRGDAGAAAAARELVARIEAICALLVHDLRRRGLTGSDAPFLEHHRGELAARISSPWLRSL